MRRIRDEKDRDDCKYVTERRVKVAVIDSGIAANMFPKTRFQIQGASFLEGSGHSATDCHWHTVANSHGTMVVSLIEKMNPLSSFYIAKVSQGSDNRGVDAMAMIKVICIYARLTA